MGRKLFHSVLLFLILSLATVFSYTLPPALGQGLGQDQAVPVNIGDKRVAIEAIMKPSFMPISETSKPMLIIRAHEENSNTTIPNIDYQVTVALHNETLVKALFHSSDGVVVADLIPDTDIDGWEINGRTKPNNRVEVSQSSPVQLRSRILSEGGLYHITAIIEKSSLGVVMQADQKFDLYVSVGTSQTFGAQTQQGESQILLKSYYDSVRNFDYSNKTISIEMPFDWDPSYVANVPVLHVEVQFPKSVKELQANSYHGTMNGKDLQFQSVVIDDYSSEQNRIVHLIVTNDMLSRFAETIKNSDVAAFTLQPSQKPKFPLDITSLPSEKFIFEIAWGPDLIETGTPTTFVMNLQDAKMAGLVRDGSFDFVLEQNETEIHREYMSSNIGTYSTMYTFSKPGKVTLSASNINGQGESAKIDLVVLQGSGNSTATQPQQQPSGCLIATAAFGSELTPQVQFLRNFRDHYILSTESGSAFMNTFNTIYYSFSPQVADYERGQPWLQSTVKTGLYPLFGILLAAQGAYSAAEGEAGSILAGATAGSLIGAVYLWPIGFAASTRVSGKWLAVAAGATLAVLTITLVALPSLLPLSTSMFVVAAAGASAIGVAKAIRHVIRH